ncbi:hypothetical protein ISCGN_000011 [Ixodes scapularis]
MYYSPNEVKANVRLNCACTELLKRKEHVAGDGKAITSCSSPLLKTQHLAAEHLRSTQNRAAAPSSRADCDDVNHTRWGTLVWFSEGLHARHHVPAFAYCTGCGRQRTPSLPRSWTMVGMPKLWPASALFERRCGTFRQHMMLLAACEPCGLRDGRLKLALG